MISEKINSGVITFMDQNDVVKTTGEDESQDEPMNKMEALLAEEGLTIDFPTRGETRKGTIASVSDGQILVSVGAKSADKQLERNADYLRAYHLKKAKSGHESKYIEPVN